MAFLYVFPYLTVGEELLLGPWRVRPLSKFPIDWPDQNLQKRTREIIAGFRGPNQKPITNPSLVVRTQPEQDDATELEAELQGLMTSLAFAVLVQNDHGNGIDWETAWPPPNTLEAAHFFALEMDLENGFAPMPQRGSLVRMRAGGVRLGDPAFVIPAPEGLIDLANVTLDPVLAEATFAVSRAGQDERNILESRVDSALHWYEKAWGNSPAVDLADRLVFFRTALEALTSTDKTKDQGPELEAIYASVALEVGAHRFLWRSDLPHYERTDARGNCYEHTAFGHWYWALADARNRIVHQTRRPESLTYERNGSPFNGNLLHTAERVCRELILISIARAGFPQVIQSDPERRMLEALGVTGSSGSTSRS